jgi:hypothetical protein
LVGVEVEFVIQATFVGDVESGVFHLISATTDNDGIVAIAEGTDFAIEVVVSDAVG